MNGNCMKWSIFGSDIEILGLVNGCMVIETLQEEESEFISTVKVIIEDKSTQTLKEVTKDGST